MSHITLDVVDYSAKISEIQAVRIQVFQVEQGVDAALEFDGLDESATHFLAYLDNQPVGTARIRYLTPQTAKIERLAVLSQARGKGIGKKLMELALGAAEHNGIEQVVINAQVYVKELYQKLGFEPVGEQFEEAGIPHVKMIKRLS